MSTSSTGLIVRFQPQPAPRLRLFCFPYAGGGSAVYRPWVSLFPPGVEVCAVQPPGRESSFGTPPITVMRTLVAKIAQAIEPLLDVPAAFFGHSLGAIAAYETALQLRKTSREPVLLAVSCHRAPALPSPRPPITQLPDDAFISEIAQLGGMPPEILANREILELFLPVLRADFQLAETYHARPAARLECPVLALGAHGDYVSEEAVAAWREVTAGPFSWRMFDGGHFYINTERAALVAGLTEALARIAVCGTGR